MFPKPRKFLHGPLVAILWVLVWSVFCQAGQRTVIRVGVYDNPPKYFSTTDGGYAGIFPDVLALVADEENWRIEYVYGTWQENLHRLEHGELDLLGDVAYSGERAQKYLFGSEPVFVNWGTVYARADIPVNSLLDLDGRTIAVMKHSIHTRGPYGIRKLLGKFEIDCRFVEVENYRDVLGLIESGAVDAGVVNRLFGSLYAADYRVSPTAIVFNPTRVMFAASKTSPLGPPILKAINRHLQRMKQDGQSRYHRILTFYVAGGRGEWRKAKSHHNTPLKSLGLTTEEKAWLRRHPVIRIGVDPEFAPFEFISPSGEFQGIAADYIKILSKRLGITFERSPGLTWEAAVAKVRRGELDMLTSAGLTRERERFLLFSRPYTSFSRVIVTRIDDTIGNLDELSGRKVAVQEASSHHGFINEKTSLKPTLFKTFQEALLAASRGEVDAVIGNLAVTSHTIRELSLTNLKIAAHAEKTPSQLHCAVRRDWPKLVGILDKALSSVTPRERRAILGRWLPLPTDASADLDLTLKEREWLLMHPRIQVAIDSNRAPVEFLTPEGKAGGISIDYLRAIEDILGVRFETIPSSNWDTLSDKLRKGEVDMLSGLSPTPERLQYLEFTRPYLSIPLVVFARRDRPYVGSLGELAGQKVAVVSGYAAEQLISRDHPGIATVPVPTTEDALKALHKGETAAFVGSMLTGSYYLGKLKYTGINVAGETPYMYHPCMAVRTDLSILTRAVQKAIDAIPDREALYLKWISVQYEQRFDYSLLWKLLVPILAVLGVFVFWNRRLTLAVREREKAEAHLQESYNQLRELERIRDELTHMIIHDMRSPLTTILGGLELAASSKDDTATEIDRYLNMCRKGTKTLQRMVGTLLDVYRLESGEMPLERCIHDLSTVAGQVVSDLQALALPDKVQVAIECTPAPACMDTEVIRRVLENLVVNAIRHTPPGGEVELTVFTRTDMATAEVKDTGSGIANDQQERIFEKFSQVGKSDENGSAGLGLAFCKLAVEAHGGKIGVKSTPGRGSTFWFSLPVS